MARVLVLREHGDAAETGAALGRVGHTALVLPLQETRRLDGEPPPGPFAGFILTSAKAAGPLAGALPNECAKPALAVGERTAQALREAGFTAVRTGPGTGPALAGAARALAAEAGLPLLYAAGRVRTNGLEAALAEVRVPFAVWEAYETLPLRPSRATVAAALGGGAPDAVLLLSAGQAGAFGRLLARDPAVFDPPPRLLCLSGRIAASLPGELRRFCEISPVPTVAALFERFL